MAGLNFGFYGLFDRPVIAVGVIIVIANPLVALVVRHVYADLFDDAHKMFMLSLTTIGIASLYVGAVLYFAG